MSQFISNLSAGNAAAGVMVSANGKAGGSQAAGQAFDQTLVAMLLGNAGSAEGGAPLQSLGLLGLTNSDEQQTADAELLNLQAVIDGLLGQLDELDQAMENDPSLLFVLQAWLQGVQLIIEPAHGDAAVVNGADGAQISVLAQHPETMRFAIQDALVQLMNTSGQLSGANSSILPYQQLLEVLQQVLGARQAANLTLDQPSGGNTANANWASILDNSIQTIVSNASSQTAGNRSNQQSADSQTAHTILASHATQNISKGSLVQVAGAAETTGVADAEELGNVLHTGNVVTAGQLAMRDGLAAPVKPPAPPVPVEQFGKEMGAFLVNKFEIIKLQGMSQARISLYPEHLGQVDVRITLQNGQLIAQFVTEHAFARESLEGQMAQLRSALQAQGLQVNKLEVTQNSSLSSHMYQDGRQQSSDAHQQQNNKRREVREEDLLALGDLNDEWNDWISEVRTREENYGSSFVARV
ncbi:flagellar hook-length control protein FliK [Paenibacillus woosongensis]|uniref:Flagellar hook-length control protein FliK n=1 Tax=Paenibacillus woosongensis TaxID=307580 RepID=A0A7X2Z161_9BACL|nr:flagellar hook-length control protein FliK [Paenibacillus woosongensis]MUG45560.1 flagellar hook-length control protein FliK [Paenibacillus woosongensis]